MKGISHVVIQYNSHNRKGSQSCGKLSAEQETSFWSTTLMVKWLSRWAASCSNSDAVVKCGVLFSLTVKNDHIKNTVPSSRSLSVSRLPSLLFYLFSGEAQLTASGHAPTQWLHTHFRVEHTTPYSFYVCVSNNSLAEFWSQRLVLRDLQLFPGW